MLSLFRTNQLAFSIWLLPYAILLRLPYFFGLITEQPISALGIGADWMGFLGAADTLVYQAAVLIVLWLQAIYLNYVHFQHRLATENHLFPGMLLLLFSSMVLPFFSSIELVLVQGFVLLITSNLLALYRSNKPAGSLLNIGFWLGMAFLFLPAAIFFVFFIFGALGALRTFSMRERWMTVFGFTAVLILTFTYYYWTENVSWLLSEQGLKNYGFLDFSTQTNLVNYVQVAIFSALSIFLVFQSSSLSQRKNMAVQKRISVFYILLLCVPTAVLFQADLSVIMLFLLVLPLSQLGGLYLGDLPKGAAEIVHMFLVLFVLASQYASFFLPL